MKARMKVQLGSMLLHRSNPGSFDPQLDVHLIYPALSTHPILLDANTEGIDVPNLCVQRSPIKHLPERAN